MRIVVHGQQAFGCAVLEKLLAQNEHIIAVCTAPDIKGKPLDPLKELALTHNLPVHQPASWKTDESLALMRSLDADVCMMVYVLLFIPEAVLNAPKHGTFQYHPSLLPMHRGPSSINWPIAMGATKTGLTIFWPNDGLDEGPILLQKSCAIGPDETLGDVYFKKLFPLGVEAMLEALDLVKRGDAPKIEQNLAAGSYQSWFGSKQSHINWHSPAPAIYNQIRAANPQPGAWTMHGETKLKIFDCELSAQDGTAGEVLAIDEHAITIATTPGAISIKRVRAAAGKIPASEYAASCNLSVGDQFC